MRMNRILFCLLALVCMAGLSACEEAESSVHTAETILQEQAEAAEKDMEEMILPSETGSSVIEQNSESVSKAPSKEPSKEVSKELTDLSQVSSVQQLFKIPQAAKSMELIAAQMSNDTQTTKLFPERDKTIVAEITTAWAVQENSEEAAADLKKSFSEQSAVFVNTAKLFEQLTGIQGVTICVRVWDANGTKLYERNFTGDAEANQPSVKVKPYASLEEYLDSPAAEMIQNEMAALYESDSVTLYVFAETDTRLVYEYQLIGNSKNKSSEKPEDALKKAEPLFRSQAQQIKSCIETDELTVVLQYIDKNYNILYEKEYTC